MPRDIDIIIDRVREQLPGVEVAQLQVTHPGDDDGLWYFSLPGVVPMIQIESGNGSCPFLFESDEQCCGEALRASTVDQAVQMVVTYLLGASNGQTVLLDGEKYWQGGAVE